jgi:nitroreductase
MSDTTHHPEPAAVELGQAAAMAGYAPSIHNTQPWHWQVHRDGMDLYAEPGRQLAVTDPDRRLLVLSCGTALHHARLALAASGWQPVVTRLPDGDGDHLAHLGVGTPLEVTGEAVRHVQSIQIRHTDRRPATATPVPDTALKAITEAANAEGASLHLLDRGQVIELAAAAAYAQRTETAESAWQAELAYWSGGDRPAGTGVPDAAIPATPTQTTVPGRDFGHAGTLAVSAEHDRGARFAILYGATDTPEAWLRAGEALSAAWLTAVEAGVAVLPLSATVEVATTRLTLRRLISEVGQPFLVLRFGVPDPDRGAPPHAPRLDTGRTVEHPR